MPVKPDMPPANANGVPHVYTKGEPSAESTEYKKLCDEAEGRCTAQDSFPIFNPMGKKC